MRNRKAIFDAVRGLLGRGFTPAEVGRLDDAIDRANQAPVPHLGALSERFESGGRGAGAVSSGKGDPGGVSYGIWQLSSRTGTAAAFVAAEGARWRAAFGDAAPGSAAFSASWRALAAHEGEAFAQAQHAFIERTHYRPAVVAVARRSGVDLDALAPAVRDACWSVAVQHGAAATILVDAIARADRLCARDEPGYARTLIEAIYAERSDYVMALARRSGLGTAAGRTLHSVVRNRFPAELKLALAMLAQPMTSGG